MICKKCGEDKDKQIEGFYNGICTSCTARDFGKSGLSITVGCEIKEPVIIPLIDSVED